MEGFFVFGWSCFSRFYCGFNYFSSYGDEGHGENIKGRWEYELMSIWVKK